MKGLNASPLSYPTQWHTWEDGRGGGGRLKQETAAKPRAQELMTHSACTCRACLSVSFEFLRAVAQCAVFTSARDYGAVRYPVSCRVCDVVF